MSEKDEIVEEAPDCYPNLSDDDKRQIIERREEREKREALGRGLVMAISGVLGGITAGVYIQFAVRGNLRGVVITAGIILGGVVVITLMSWYDVLLIQKQLSNNDSNDEQSQHKLTVSKIDCVFDKVRGPTITTTDVTEHVNCTRESAQEKLQQLNDRRYIARREVGRRELWWRTGGGLEHDTDDEQGEQTADIGGEGEG